jgi:hypothetical protein
MAKRLYGKAPKPNRWGKRIKFLARREVPPRARRGRRGRRGIL